MQDNSMISIVVPIYNVEAYLPQCLDSILGQTYSNIEVLLVDDGSPDGCGVICDEYAVRDSRIKVFHIPNGGVAKARQLGVENSTGEFIIFVDPDDWLPLDSVEVLYSNMADDVDLVVGGYSLYCGVGVFNPVVQDDRVETREQWLKGMLSSVNIDSGAPWGKLYRRGLL